MRLHLIRALALSAAGAGVGYLAFAAARLIGFSRRRSQPCAQAQTGVTILKPLYGDEPELFENLCSFCEQDHERLQVIFGVQRDDDPAIRVVERVVQRFPERDLALVVDTRMRCQNRKIANILNMMERAKHEVIFVADSDTRVGPSYVSSVLAPFDDPDIGAVTCLYRGVSRSGLVSELGALFINDQFAPSVLVAIALSKMDFAFGATMAVRRSVLERIGGFAAVGTHLADDRMLGRRVHEAGFRVALSDYVVEHDVTEDDLKTLWAHELRWARTMSSARPAGYAFSVITYAVPLACIAWALSPNVAGGVVTAAAMLARVAVHVAARRALRIRSADKPWLIPARDVLGLCVWAATFFGKEVRWRDDDLRIDAQGRIVSRT
jgi:ceramide glucosyltransferase